MKSGTILLVSDESGARGTWTDALVRAGLAVTPVPSAREALERWEEGGYDLGVIALGDPAESLELCRALRARAANPILLLCSEGSEGRSVAAYEAGADECVPRPVGPPLLLAKVTAWLRHQWTIRTESLVPVEVGGTRLDPARREVTTADGRAAGLTALEFRLLYVLMCHAEKVVPFDLLVRRVWGPCGGGNRRQLRHMVRHLRRKLESKPCRPSIICTVRRQGYSFRVAESGPTAALRDSEPSLAAGGPQT